MGSVGKGLGIAGLALGVLAVLVNALILLGAALVSPYFLVFWIGTVWPVAVIAIVGLGLAIAALVLRRRAGLPAALPVVAIVVCAIALAVDLVPVIAALIGPTG